MENERLLKKAKKHVKKKKDFFAHAAIMAAISLFLFLLAFINNDGDYSWVFIAVGGMLLSIAFHYIGAFGMGGLDKGLENWEADALEDEYLRLKELEDRKKELLDADKLRLKQLEKRYKGDDYV